MRITTGIDLVEISRMKKSIENPRFLTRVFSDAERVLFQQRNFSAETIAANFAGKEAFSKAMMTGIRGFALSEVSVLRDNMGAPYLSLTGKAEELAQGYKLSISLTHTENYASAVVVAYQDV